MFKLRLYPGFVWNQTTVLDQFWTSAAWEGCCCSEMEVVGRGLRHEARSGNKGVLQDRGAAGQGCCRLGSPGLAVTTGDLRGSSASREVNNMSSLVSVRAVIQHPVVKDSGIMVWFCLGTSACLGAHIAHSSMLNYTWTFYTGFEIILKIIRSSQSYLKLFVSSLINF